MNNIRENQNAYTKTKERNLYEYDEFTARNEFSNEKEYIGLDKAEDFDSLLYFSQGETVNENVVPAPRTQKNMESDDTMPSMVTMQYKSAEGFIDDSKQAHKNIVFYDSELDIETDSDKQYRINTKGKILIAVYALVVLTIFALIIINTRLIRNLNNEAAEIQSQIETLKEKATMLKEELKIVSDDEEIIRKAQELGMIEK